MSTTIHQTKSYLYLPDTNNCFTSVRITYRKTQKRREAQLLLLASHLEARRNCPVCRNEQRRKPHADMYDTSNALYVP